MIQLKPLIAVYIYIYIGDDDDDPGEIAHRRAHLLLSRCDDDERYW